MSNNRQIPEELVIEILKRLPAKSLLRFTAVSKWWCNLITSPAFISAQHRNAGNSATNNLLFVVFRDYEEEKYIIINDIDHQFLTEPPIPIKLSKEYFRVVGCHNGIVCLSGNHDVTLWNPSIRKFRRLPCPSILPDHYLYDSVLGFGVSPPSVDDIKVVRIVYEIGIYYEHLCKIPTEVEIYSLKTGMWTRITPTGLNYCINYDIRTQQAFVNGAVHWIGYKLLEYERLQSLIAVFNMGDELFGEIMLPRELAREVPFDLSVMVWDESVAIAKYSISGLCELWVMKEYGVVESWTRLHSIQLVGEMRKIVGFRKSGEVMLSTYTHKLVSYCPNTRVINDLGIYGISRSFYVDKYLESLALLQEQTHPLDELCEEMTSL